MIEKIDVEMNRDEFYKKYKREAEYFIWDYFGDESFKWFDNSNYRVIIGEEVGVIIYKGECYAQLIYLFSLDEYKENIWKFIEKDMVENEIDNIINDIIRLNFMVVSLNNVSGLRMIDSALKENIILNSLNEFGLKNIFNGRIIKKKIKKQADEIYELISQGSFDYQPNEIKRILNIFFDLEYKDINIYYKDGLPLIFLSPNKFNDKYLCGVIMQRIKG